MIIFLLVKFAEIANTKTKAFFKERIKEQTRSSKQKVTRYKQKTMNGEQKVTNNEKKVTINK